MIKYLWCLFASLISIKFCAQDIPPSGFVQNPEFDLEIGTMLTGKVPYISVKELYANLSDYLILDAREIEEFETSHIPGAIYIGYRSLDKEQISKLPNNKKIAVYCSVGYRSEKAGQKLLDSGFKDVSNVYGSIFEWVNQGYPIVKNGDQPVNQIHTYNKKWSKWITNQKIEKIW